MKEIYLLFLEVEKTGKKTTENDKTSTKFNFKKGVGLQQTVLGFYYVGAKILSTWSVKDFLNVTQFPM